MKPIVVVPPRLDARAPARAGTHGPGGAWRYLAAALVAIGLVILVPILVTAVSSRPAPDAEILAGIGIALRNSLIWIGFALGVCLLGLLLARLVRDVGRPLRVLLFVTLALPAVTSPLAAGTAFRLIFDHRSERGIVGALLGHDVYAADTGWLWAVLGLAFAWQWTGVAFLVFHAGWGRVPAGLRRIARIFGAGRLRQAWLVLWPALFPTAAIAVLIVLTAASRVFDLVLVIAPWSLQDQVEPLGLYWWRERDALGAGRAAALAIVLFLVGAVFTLIAAFGLRREWPRGERSTPPDRAGPAARTAAAVVAAVWATPFVVLVLTSFRSPVAAAREGVWAGGYGFGSYAAAFADGAFAAALQSTAVRAVTVAALVIAMAVPAAYALTYGPLPRRTSRRLVVAAAAMAIVPPQVLAVPLGWATDQLGAGTMILAAVQAALLLPLAILLLRNAFLSVPRPLVLRPLAEGRSALLRVASAARPAVVTAAVLAFTLAWNDLVVGLLLSWPAADQVPLVMLQQVRQFATSAGPLAAQAVVATAVPAALVLALGPRLVRGLTQGVDR